MGHTSFIANGDKERDAMLAAVGAKSIDDLFAAIPQDWLRENFAIPEGKPEWEVDRHLRSLAQCQPPLLNFCGAGYYDHFIPAAVDALTSRGEFYTAYTPYQPEASQGTLQAIYEYQSAIVRLTDMEVANASLYDGGTALAEAVLMAVRISGRKKVLVDEAVHPLYRQILQTYLRCLPISYEEVAAGKDGLADRQAWLAKYDDTVAAAVWQNPNFFGCVDDLSDLVKAAKERGIVTVMSVYPISLGLIKTPGEMGVDIVTAEGQSLGLPLSFGGPYLGVMATRKEYVRKMPGRIVGATTDAQGRRGYVLTLQAREQHIRRQKATSNICSNEALCALRAVVYLSLLGRQGLVGVADECARAAAFAAEGLEEVGVKLRYPQTSFFNEFVVTLPKPAAEVVAELAKDGIVAGCPLSLYYPNRENELLVACTEKRSLADIRSLISRLSGAGEISYHHPTAWRRSAPSLAMRGV